MKIDEAKDKLDKTLKVMGDEFAKLQGSRANPQLIEDIEVEVYGSKMPIKQLGTVTVADPTLITVQCWDKNNVEEVKKAVAASDLNVTPSVDGALVRVPLPPLTQERREELVKVAKGFSEEAKIAVRNIRRDFIDSLEAEGVSEDEMDRGKKEIQKSVERTNEAIDEKFKNKEQELLTI